MAQRKAAAVPPGRPVAAIALDGATVVTSDGDAAAARAPSSVTLSPAVPNVTLTEPSRSVR
jgi:hypothetical protein